MNKTAAMPPAIFTYVVTPSVVPYANGAGPSNVTLFITVVNQTGAVQACSRIVLALPVGASAGSLTVGASSIVATPVQGTAWSITSDAAGNFTAEPLASVTGLNPGEAIAFVLANVSVNTMPGLASIQIYEGTTPIRQAQASVAKVHPGLAITSLVASQIQVTPGQPCPLSWTTTGAISCTLSWHGQSIPVETSGATTVRPSETTTYALTATGRGASTSQQITIVVSQVHILSFTANPEAIAPGARSTLAWQVANADTCVITPGDLLVDAKGGTLGVVPRNTTVYTLTASGSGRSVSMPAVVTVLAPAAQSS